MELERDGQNLLIHVESKSDDGAGDLALRQGDELVRKLESAGFRNRYENVLTNGRWTIKVSLVGRAQQKMLAQMVLDVLEDVAEPYPS